MASEGPNSPSSAVNTDEGSEIAWVNPGNVTASDNNRATATAALDDVNSQALDVTGFGFSIPAGASITGILLELERSASAFPEVRDVQVQLLDASSPVGD